MQVRCHGFVAFVPSLTLFIAFCSFNCVFCHETEHAWLIKFHMVLFIVLCFASMLGNVKRLCFDHTVISWSQQSLLLILLIRRVFMCENKDICGDAASKVLQCSKSSDWKDSTRLGSKNAIALGEKFDFFVKHFSTWWRLVLAIVFQIIVNNTIWKWIHFVETIWSWLSVHIHVEARKWSTNALNTSFETLWIDFQQMREKMATKTSCCHDDIIWSKKQRQFSLSSSKANSMHFLRCLLWRFSFWDGITVVNKMKIVLLCQNKQLFLMTDNLVDDTQKDNCLLYTSDAADE